MTSNYKRGSARERRIVNNLRDEGFLAFRSAGSHSPIDICAISKNGFVYFLQCKPKNMSKKARERLKKEYEWLNKKFDCRFKVISLFSELNYKEVK